MNMAGAIFPRRRLALMRNGRIIDGARNQDVRLSDVLGVRIAASLEVFHARRCGVVEGAEGVHGRAGLHPQLDVVH
jgi:hypothetical protein